MLDEGVRAGLEFLGVEYRTVCYVERDSSAASTLVARMEDQAVDCAPVWDDLVTFDCGPWRGAVDLVHGGFPCQPWSVAGKREGHDDERWLWPDIARIIRELEPRLCFLENVPGLVSGGGLEHVLSDLAALGFDAQWTTLPASAVGAGHGRERVFILAVSTRGGCRELRESSGSDGLADGGDAQLAHSLRVPSWERARRERVLDVCEELAHAQHPGQRGCGAAHDDHGRDASRDDADRRDPHVANAIGADLERRGDARILGGAPSEESGEGIQRQRTGGAADDSGNDVADADLSRSQGRGPAGPSRGRESGARSRDWGVFAPGPNDRRWAEILRDSSHLAPAIEPGLRCVVDGHPVVLDAERTDQLRCIGNGVVPLQAAAALVHLVRELGCL